MSGITKDDLRAHRACGSCNPSRVRYGTFNGIVHEAGCPDAWRDERRECRWCGSEFQPEERRQRYCDVQCAGADS